MSKTESVEKNIKSVVIVESPAKAKTIEKYLGSDFTVTSSLGHIRDLPKKGMSIDIENGFKPTYEISPDKEKLVKELKKLVANSDKVWLATDEDREGEAIAWHLYEALNLKKKETKRIVFHEITKPAILKAINNPRDLNLDTVDAQQARRILDRLVGYELSPILWKKVRRGLSAGRVQSVSVRMVVDREREIDAFNNEFFYKVVAEFNLDDGLILKAELKTKFKDFEKALAFLESIKHSEYKVKDIVVKPAKKSPAPPFTTSTLQQEASRKLGFSVKKTMTVAQKLYEAGIITYMRTDSVNLSETATDAIAEQINSQYGNNYHKFRKYVTSSAGAQEAHEAIRPTNMAVTSLKGAKDDAKLYDLIWKRSIASQMEDAQLERTSVNISISNSKELFAAQGEVIRFDGFLKVYMESRDDDNEDEEFANLLPPLTVGQLLDLNKAVSRQTFKRPPARFNEATLVKKLEEMGIGRPSTYAPTISTIQDRGYVEKKDLEGQKRDYFVITLKNSVVKKETKSETFGSEKAKLFPTDIGIIVTDFLLKFFPAIIDYNFTAKVEEEFDEVAKGNKKWGQMISEFYESFHPAIEEMQDIKRSDAVQAREVGIDTKTGKIILARFGKFGPMLQLGTNEEEPKFAQMPKNQKIDTITLEEAIKLLELPRILGNATDGEEISTQIGRYGPYIKKGKANISITQEEVYTISLEEAIAKLDSKISGVNVNAILLFDEGKIQVVKGRFGPYITDGTKNVKIPRNINPEQLTEEDCLKMLATGGSDIKSFEGSTIRILKGRFGPYITDGKSNASVPKSYVPEDLSIEDCLKILAETEEKRAKKANN